MLDAIEKMAKLTNELINEIVAQMEATLEHGKKHIKWYTKELNEALFQPSYSRPKIVGDALGKRMFVKDRPVGYDRVGLRVAIRTGQRGSSS